MDGRNRKQQVVGFGASIILLLGVSVARYGAFHVAAYSFTSATAFCFAALTVAAVIALGIHKPWVHAKKVKITERDVLRFLFAGLTLAVATFTTLYCLRVMGSLRGFLFDYADIAVVVAIPAALASTRKVTTMRGLGLFAAGALLLLLYSPPSTLTSLPSAVAYPLGGEGGAGLDAGAEVASGFRRLLTLDVAAPNVDNNNDAFGAPAGGVEDVFSPPQPLPLFAPSDGDAQAQPTSPRRLSPFSAAGRVKVVLDSHTLASVALAALFMIGASWVHAIRRRITKSLAEETALGNRRCHALVIAAAWAVWAPIALIRWVFAGVGDASAPQPEQASSVAFYLGACVFGAVVLVFAEVILDAQLPLTALTQQLGISDGLSVQPRKASADSVLVRVITVFVGTLFGVGVCTAWGSPAAAAQVTWALLVGGFGLYLPGCLIASGIDLPLVLASIYRRLEDTRGGDGRTDSSWLAKLGILGGIRTLMQLVQGLAGEGELPTHTDSLARAVSDEGIHTAGDLSFGKLTHRVMKHVWDDKNSRKIFLFLLINFSFMFVEIVVGWMNNSLGLISDAGHMFFDNASLFIGLYASYMSRWKADAKYTYGYARYEVLAGFVNAIFLVFVGFSVVFEAIERLWEPPEIHAEHVLPVSIMGLLVNIIGLVFFHDAAHSHGGHGHAHGPPPPPRPSIAVEVAQHGHSHTPGGPACSHDHAPPPAAANASHHGHAHGGGGGCDHGGGGGTNENMYGVYLHVMADALGSIGVIASSLLIKYFGWHLADPIASICISALIVASVIPLLQTTTGPLLSRIPEHMEHSLYTAVENIRRLTDVLQVDHPHFWKFHADLIVGTLHVRARAEVDDQRLLRQARKLLSAAGVHSVTIQIEKEVVAGAFMSSTSTTSGAQAPAFISTAAASHNDHHDHDHHGHDHDHHGHDHDHHGHDHDHDDGVDAHAGCSHGHGEGVGSHGHSHAAAHTSTANNHDDAGGHASHAGCSHGHAHGHGETHAHGEDSHHQEHEHAHAHGAHAHAHGGPSSHGGVHIDVRTLA